MCNTLYTYFLKQESTFCTQIEESWRLFSIWIDKGIFLWKCWYIFPKAIEQQTIGDYYSKKVNRYDKRLQLWQVKQFVMLIFFIMHKVLC